MVSQNGTQGEQRQVSPADDQHHDGLRMEIQKAKSHHPQHVQQPPPKKILASPTSLSPSNAQHQQPQPTAPPASSQRKPDVPSPPLVHPLTKCYHSLLLRIRTLFSHLHHLRHSIVAILLVIASQFLMWGLDRLVKLASDDFPAAIVGMILVFLVMSWCNRIDSRVEAWYARVLGESAGLVNRHMSIGFTVPFVQALNLHFRDTRHIGIAIGCFCVTGILNTAMMYLIALRVEKSCTHLHWRKEKAPDEERGLSQPHNGDAVPPSTLFGIRSRRAYYNHPCGQRHYHLQAGGNVAHGDQKRDRQAHDGHWTLRSIFQPFIQRSRSQSSPDCHSQSAQEEEDHSPRILASFFHFSGFGRQGHVPRSDTRSPTLVRSDRLTTPESRNSWSKHLSGTSTLSAVPSSLLVGAEEDPTPIPSRVPSPIPEGRSVVYSRHDDFNTQEMTEGVELQYVSPTQSTSSLTVATQGHPPQRPAVSSTSDSPSCSTTSETTTSKSPCRFSNLLPYIPLILSGSLIPLVGVPLAFFANHTTTLDTLILFTFWFGTMTLQSLIRGASWGRITSPHQANHPVLCHVPALHNGVVVLLNAVLVSSLGMIVYIVLKNQAMGNRTLDQILDEFVRKTDISSLFGGTRTNTKETSKTLPAGMGAGDIATSILNAGIVVWGFKLFECRTQLLSFSGITVVIVSAVAAVSNFFLGPMLGSAMGLDASEALAFAARSVTLALGGPVVDHLGGNITTNAAMVVLNGLAFQISGDWIFRKMRLDPGAIDDSLPNSSARSSSRSDSHQTQESTVIATDVITPGCQGPDKEQARIVAAGVTVGINAAAMGTAHLYERCSDAAPFAALSMTVIGVVTVIVSAIRPVSEFIVLYVGGTLEK